MQLRYYLQLFSVALSLPASRLGMIEWSNVQHTLDTSIPDVTEAVALIELNPLLESSSNIAHVKLSKRATAMPLRNPGQKLFDHQFCAAPLDKQGRYKLCITCIGDGIRCAWGSMNPLNNDISCWCVPNTDGKVNRINTPKAGCLGGTQVDSQTCVFRPSSAQATNAKLCDKSIGFAEFWEDLRYLAGFFTGNMPYADAKRPVCPLRTESDTFTYPGPLAGTSNDDDIIAQKAETKRLAAEAKEAEKQAKKAARELAKRKKKEAQEVARLEKIAQQAEKQKTKRTGDEDVLLKNAIDALSLEDDIVNEQEDELVDDDSDEPKPSKLAITREEFAEARAALHDEMRTRSVVLQLDEATQMFSPVYRAEDTYQPQFTFSASMSPGQILMRVREQLRYANGTAGARKRQTLSVSVDAASAPVLHFDGHARKWQVITAGSP